MSRDISLTGGGPWGFTLSGGKDFGAPLKVSKITPGGKAAKGGIRFGDYIVEINGDSTEGLLHSDAMMLIKTTGVSLLLKVTKEVPQLPTDTFGDDPNGEASNRPCPPPVPSSPHGGVSPAQHKTTTVVIPKKSASVASVDVKAQPSGIVPESGLDSGGSSTQQSPAFKRISVVSKQAVIINRPTDAPDSPLTQPMRNVVIEDGNVLKTSQRPQPPPNTPTTFTKTTAMVSKKDPPFAKPSPPVTSVGTTQVGGQQPTSPSGSKVVDRQGVCDACQQPIRGPFASAMGKVWHPEHFICSDCQKSLQNTTFVFEEEKIFCDECYQKNFAQTCHSCQKPIAGPSISAVGLNWHQDHFTCSRCSTDLSKGSGFNMENNMLYCSDCFGEQHGATCHGCGQKVGGNELWVEALDHQWHPTCFICESCNTPLEGSTFFSRQGKPCCKNCL